MSKWRSARVFISSTFRDFHGERDYLTRYVFPELQERAAKLCVRVTPVDLRWGVTEEATQQALELCLGEIDNCRPFFIGMLGERYGWTPDSYDVPDEPQFDWVKRLPKGYSITHMEILHGALNCRPINHAALYLRDPTFMQNVPQEHMRDFQSENAHAKTHLEELKKRIRDMTEEVVVFDAYPCGWRGVVDGKPMAGGLEAFGQHVLEFLWARFLVSYPPPLDAAAAPDPLAASRAEHEAFVDAHSRGFVGREELLAAVGACEGSAAPCVVVGEPGGGKTSLMAAFCRRRAAALPVVAHFVGAAPGSTDIRRALSRLCGEIARALRLEGADAAVPQDYGELKALFAKLLTARAAAWGGRLVVVVDAVNQLDSAYSALSLEWLPLETAPNATLLVSTLPGRCLDVLRRRGAREVVVGPLCAAEQREIVRRTLWDSRTKLDERPGSDQLGALLAKADAQRPLYLVVACEELRVFGVYERVADFIAALPETVAGLFAAVLARLEADHTAEAVRHSLCLVRCSRGGLFESELLELLGYAAQMLTPIEGPLRQPLSHNVWARLYRSLRPYFSPAGEGGEGLLNFFHQQLAFAVDARYLSSAGGDMYGRTHRRLAEFWLAKADPRHDGSWAGDARALGELPHHQTRGRMWSDLARTLCDLGFIEARCRSGTSYELVADYLAASGESLAAGDSDDGAAAEFAARFPDAARRVHDFQEFLQARVHVMAKRPHETFCLAANLPADSAPSAAARDRWTRGVEKRAWLDWTNKPQRSSACVLTFVGHELPCRACHVSPADATAALSAADDGTIRLFDARTGEEKLTLRGHRGAVLSAVFAPDGRTIASGSADRSVRLWNAATGAEIAKGVGHKGPVNRVAFSPDGALLCSASLDKTARIWRAADLTPRGVLPHGGCVFGADWSPDGRWLATGCSNKCAYIWRAEGDELVAQRSVEVHTKTVASVKFSADSALLATASEDRAVAVWRFSDMTRLHLFEDAFDGVCDAEFTRDGKRLVTVGHDNVLRVYGLDTPPRLECSLIGHTGSVFNCFASPNGTHVATCSFDRSVKIWDMARTGENMAGHLARILCVSFSPTGAALCSASRDKTLKVWNVATKDCVTDLRGHTSNVYSCAFCPTDGDVVLSGSRDNSLKLWDAKTGQCTLTIEAHTSTINSCCWSPDGATFVSASADKLVKLWDPRVGGNAPICTFFGHRADVTSCAWSPNGLKIATGSEDLTCKLWDARTHRKLATLSGHTKGVSTCAFSKDSARVLTGADDNEVREWDAARAKLLHTMHNNVSAITSLCCTADGKKLVVGSTDCSFVVYDAANKRPLASFTLLCRVTGVAASPVGNVLAAGDGSGGLYILSPCGM